VPPPVVSVWHVRLPGTIWARPSIGKPGALLVSDDQVELKAEAGRLFAAAPKTIAGQMEVRGVGIVAMEHVSPMPVALLLDLDTLPERLPDLRLREVCGLGDDAKIAGEGKFKSDAETIAPIRGDHWLATSGWRSDIPGEV